MSKTEERIEEINNLLSYHSCEMEDLEREKRRLIAKQKEKPDE